MGYGSKTNFVRKGGISPGLYNVLGEFDRIGIKAKKKGIGFRLGRSVIYIIGAYVISSIFRWSMLQAKTCTISQPVTLHLQINTLWEVSSHKQETVQELEKEIKSPMIN